jgi:Flp pilus assembly protein TadD
MQSPIEFTIATADFDRTLLPAGLDVTSQAFTDAVRQYYVEQLEPLGGQGFVNITADEIHVRWIPDKVARNPVAFALELLRKGDLNHGSSLLEILRTAEPDRTDILYNLGMALSDLNRLQDAKKHLKHLVEIEPENANAWIALGVAHQRADESSDAVACLERSVKLDSTNAYAHRNLAAVFGSLGKLADAERHLREAYSLMEHDQMTVYGLAYALEKSDDDAKVSEADQLTLKPST